MWIVWVVIGIILVLVLAVGGFVLFALSNRTPLYVKYGEEAIKENNLSVCLKATDPHTYPMDCWKYAAYQNKEMSINLCNSVEPEVQRDNCYTGFIYSRWTNYQQILCEDLANSKDKDYCYMVTALSSKNASFCDKITNTGTAIADCKNNIVSAS